MSSFEGRRSRLSILLVAALGALSIFVLPSLAGARGSSDDSDSSATIKSFDPATKLLVVALPDGQTVSGTVTRRTKIRCEDQSGHRHGGDRVRGREAEPGDDHGGHGNEVGDDNGGNSSGPSNSGSGSSGHDDNGSGANCSTADLVAGAAVEEIELEFRGSTVIFDEVELDD
ncbi:MAG TPA: hypothetical protein VEW07_00865 [Solirubrobacterales bacterium]|nr:hypothetical protein [Solirubrobacterales bacterium]